MDLLKLAAFDAEDLAVLSAHVQDAVAKVGDIVWEPRARRLIVGLNRFDWESQASGKSLRRRSALRIDRALSLKSHGISPAARDVVLNILALRFEETLAPAGHITLVCSGDKALRVEVECLEAALADLGPVWSAAACPTHEAASTAPEERPA
jgi:Protein of unknown function (DUF2948)